MATYDRDSMKRWQDWLALALGLWLLVSPWLLGYSALQAATWNAVILGVGIAVFAGAALAKPASWEEWINLALGVWLVISPWVLGFSDATAATWNQVIVGLIVAADAAFAMTQSQSRLYG